MGVGGMVNSMCLEQANRSVEALFRDRFGADAEGVTVEICTDEFRQEVLVTLLITSSNFERSYRLNSFGLTNAVMKALGKEFWGYFPVINPVDNVAHA